MHFTETNANQNVQVVCRRMLFVCTLLGMGVASAWITGAYSNEREHLFNMTSSSRWSGRHYFHALIWGISFSPVVLLGVWLVARKGWWETWFGRVRAAVYVSAYLYGSILTAFAQRWLNELAPNGLPRWANGPSGLYANYILRYHFPGTQINAYYNDYSRPTTDIVLLLAVVLLLTPMMMFCSYRPDVHSPKQRISIQTLLWWTTLTAVTLSYFQFLSQWYSPDTGYSSVSFSYAMTEFAFETLPATATTLIAIFWLARTPQFQLRFALLCLVGLLIVDFLCDRIVMGTLDHFGLFHRRASPLGGPDRWAFQAGRIVGVWTGLAIAARLGLSISELKEISDQSVATVARGTGFFSSRAS